MGTKFKDFLKEQMNDIEFRKEYEALEDEENIIQSLIDVSNEEILYLIKTA